VGVWALEVPVWSKMTPNITDITAPSRVCLQAGTDGIAAINTIQSISAVDLDTLRPQPCVEGMSTYGGYSSTAVKPIALARVASIAGLIRDEYAGQGKSLSGIGGVNTGLDAAEFILLGRRYRAGLQRGDDARVSDGEGLHP
jgi:dihydropyrimidine dehydrogenase (NADP+)